MSVSFRSVVGSMFLMFVVSAAGNAADRSAGSNPLLPPLQQWSGRSESLVVAKNDPWITPSEKDGLLTTPRYDETIAWLRRLADASPEIELVSIGKSAEGRDIWMVIASREGKFTAPEIRESGKAIVLAHAGIHGGEIDGKDAGLMLLRDMTTRGTKRQLLERATFLFIPIFNVDGHERFNRFGRINQRGPAEMGWRTTSRNLNLNRDYTKLDSSEVQSIVRVLNEFDPDLYLDMHVTDGADYQYDLTYGNIVPGAWSTTSAQWLDRNYTPAVNRALREMGHVPGPLAVATFDPANLAKGIYDWPPTPRFSTSYGDLRHTPTILLENHVLKSYRQRVLGTYVFLEETLRVAGSNLSSLRAAVAEDRARRRSVVPLSFTVSDRKEPIDFLGIEAKLERSDISGAVQEHYTGKPVTIPLTIRTQLVPAVTATRPVAYWIPAAWSDIAAKLIAHGIRVEKIDGPVEKNVEMYRLMNPTLDTSWNEGRVRVSATPVVERRTERFIPGSYRVTTDQPLGELAMVLLEPASSDSLFQWGFFHSILEPTEYVESYVMEPTARKMLEEDPALRAEFERKLIEDEAFRNNSQERLQWFYKRTPFHDERARLYPIARETE